MRFSLLTGLTVALTLLANTFTSAADEVTLRYNLDNSNPLKYVSTMKMEMTQKILGQNQNIAMSQRDHAVWTFKEMTKQKNFVVQTENKLLVVEMTIPVLGKVKFDSANPDAIGDTPLANQLKPVYSSMSGAILDVVVSPEGDIKEVRGYEELLKNALKDNPVAAQFVGGGSEKAAISGQQETFPLLPEKAISVGDTWEREYTMDLQNIGTAKGKRIYKLVDLSEKDGSTIATIESTSEMDFDLKFSMNGADGTGTLTIAASKGAIVFDVDAGKLLKSEGKVKLTGNMTISAGGQTIPLTMTQTQTYSRIAVDEFPTK